MKSCMLFVSALVSAIGIMLSASNASAQSSTETYDYDALGRLISIKTTGGQNNNETHSICYDDAGNRTQYVSDTSGSPSTCSGSGGGGTQSPLSIGNASATEGGTLSFTVTRSAPTTTVVTVNYATGNISAIAGSDYTAKSGTLSFSSGQTSKVISVTTINDTTTENTETMKVTLSSPSSNATIANAVGTGTIIDNDSGWSSSLTSGQWSYCYYTCTYYYGYLSGLMGSMSNTAYNSYTVTGVYSTGSTVIFYLSGSSIPPNSGWTSITIPGVGTLNRTSATYSTGSTYAMWTWTNSSTIASGTVTVQ